MSPPDRTADGHHVVVDGRRWRASDPLIPDGRRQALVDALMTHRRAVQAARRSGDGVALASARAGIQAAKVALGERGPAWWDQTDVQRRERWSAEVPGA